jgi:sterol 14-demethylase
MTMMRMVKTPQQIMGMTIPVGGYCCASPTVNHILEEAWGQDNLEFNPDRFRVCFHPLVEVPSRR